MVLAWSELVVEIGPLDEQELYGEFIKVIVKVRAEFEQLLIVIVAWVETLFKVKGVFYPEGLCCEF